MFIARLVPETLYALVLKALLFRGPPELFILTCLWTPYCEYALLP